MTAKARVVVLAGVCAAAAGRRGTISASYWMPGFSSTQQSGAGGDVLDLDTTLGVTADESVMVYEFVGDTEKLAGQLGRHRVRVTYWKIHAEGQASPAAFLFAGDSYPGGNTVDSVLDLDSVDILYEPALIAKDGFRFRLAVGFNLLRFKMTVNDPLAPLYNVLNVPGANGPLSSVGLDYIPVPVVGAGFQAALTPWLKLVGRAQLFDAQYLNLDASFGGKFMTAVGGVLFGKAKGFRVFTGFRHFHAEYAYNADSGDSTIGGPVVELSLRF